MATRVLLVGKDLTTSDLLVPGLEREGYQVTLARSRRRAESRCQSVPPDILVIDVASFGLAGYAVVDAVRSRLGSVPVILLLEEGHAIAKSQAAAFMTPPFTSRKLLYRLRKVAEALPSRQLQAGDLVLDPLARTLRKGQSQFHLRPKEAALLAFFMRNPGRVLSREEIMNEVWDTDYLDDTRTLNVHIRWLRLKIEDDPSQPRMLRTVRGVGYRFEVRALS
jgi:DNA-binding response OmpR family regulator